MLEWIVGGIVLAVVAIVVGILLGRRARIRRREAWQRFAAKNGYRFDEATDSIHGEIGDVPFQIRAFTREDDDGEVESYTEVTFEAEVALEDPGKERTRIDASEGWSGWERPGRARRTKVLRREVDAIARALAERD